MFPTGYLKITFKEKLVCLGSTWLCQKMHYAQTWQKWGNFGNRKWRHNSIFKITTFFLLQGWNVLNCLSIL